jgi:hypothetical protein
VQIRRFFPPYKFFYEICGKGGGVFVYGFQRGFSIGFMILSFGGVFLLDGRGPGDYDLFV